MTTGRINQVTAFPGSWISAPAEAAAQTQSRFHVPEAQEFSEGFLSERGTNKPLRRVKSVET